MASGKKTLRATWRAPVPPAVRRPGGCRRVSPCPETLCLARGIPAPVLQIRSGRSRRRSGDPVLPVPSCSPGQHHYCRGRTVCRRRGRRAWMLCPASGCPVSRMGGAPRILLLTTGRPDMRAGIGICSGPGRGNCATPGFIRTDVGMPVADDRIDMCRTGPPCNATAGKAGNDTMDSPALPAVLTRAPSPAFPVRKTGAAVRFSLRFYAGMVRREASGARCEPAAGDVRSAQARLTAGRAGCRHPGNTRSLVCFPCHQSAAD